MLIHPLNNVIPPNDFRMTFTISHKPITCFSRVYYHSTDMGVGT